MLVKNLSGETVVARKRDYRSLGLRVREGTWGTGVSLTDVLVHRRDPRRVLAVVYSIWDRGDGICTGECIYEVDRYEAERILRLASCDEDAAGTLEGLIESGRR